LLCALVGLTWMWSKGERPTHALYVAIGGVSFALICVLSTLTIALW